MYSRNRRVRAGAVAPSNAPPRREDSFEETEQLIEKLTGVSREQFDRKLHSMARFTYERMTQAQRAEVIKLLATFEARGAIQ